jgi:hypothetical protein
MDTGATPGLLSQMLTLEQVAWVLQKPARTVRLMTRKREIESNKMGGDLRYLRQDVWAYIRKTRRVAIPTGMSDPAAEDLDWGCIERLITIAVQTRAGGEFNAQAHA